MLASIGVPLAIDFVRKIIGKGMQTQPPPPPRARRSPPIPPPKGKGMQIQPPPFFGTWDDYYRLKKNWCNFLRIPIAEMKQNPFFIPHALSTWMISEVWELIGYVVGLMKALASISIHLGFHHLWNGTKKCQCTG